VAIWVSLWLDTPCLTGQSTRTPKGVRACGAPIPWSPVISNVIRHGSEVFAPVELDPLPRSHARDVNFPVQHGLRSGERVRAVGLTRAGVVAKSRAPDGRSQPLRRAGLLHHWLSCTSTLPWSPMPPSYRQHLSLQSHSGALGWLALAATAAYNRSINTDAQVRPLAALAPCPCAGYLQRWAAWQTRG
jgi:hypothetical protein